MPRRELILDWILYESLNARCNVEYLLHPAAVHEVVEALLGLRDDQPLHLVSSRFRMRRGDISSLWDELEEMFAKEAAEVGADRVGTSPGPP